MAPSKKRWQMIAVSGYGAFAVIGACTTTVLQAEAPSEGGAPLPDGAAALDAARPPAERDGNADANAIHDADAGSAADGGRDARVVDCGPPPTQIFTSPLGPFCPFQAANVFSNCAVGEHCCEYAEEAGVASTCSAGATACGVEIATGFDWRCDERNDCPGGQVCCFAGPITPDLQCTGHYNASASVHSTACRVATCAAGEMRTCGSQDECPLGTQCTAMRLRGKHFGFCKP